MARESKNSLIHFLPVSGMTHFSILGPANELIASKILRDEGPTTNIAFTDDELGSLNKKMTTGAEAPRAVPKRSSGIGDQAR